MSATDVAIQLGGLNNTGTGSIGTPGSPLLLALSTLDGVTALGLEVGTSGQNAFLSSQSSVNISNVDGTLGIQGVNLTGATPVGNFTVSAAGQITQASGITASNLSVTTTGAGNAITLNDSNTSTGNMLNGTVRFHSAGDVTFNNEYNNPTTLGSSVANGTMTINADNSALYLIDGSDTSGVVVNSSAGAMGAGTLVLSALGDVAQGITNNHVVTDDTNAIPIIANTLNVSVGDAAILLTENTATLRNGISGPVTLSTVPNFGSNVAFYNVGSTSTEISSIAAGGTVNIVSGGSLTVDAGSGVSAGLDTSSAGDISFVANGTVTINGPINTTGALVDLDAGGSMFVNANISSPANGQGQPGTIILIANDPSLAGGSDSAGIFNGDGVTLTAATINLDAAAGGPDGLSGGIGMGASNPLALTSDTGTLSLAVETFGGIAYLSSAVPVSIDAGVNGDGVNGILTSDGGTSCNGNPCYGEVFLTAAGSITQTFGIQSGILTLTATGSNGNIALTDTGSMSDPGNSVFGQIHLYSSGSATYSSGYSNTMGANLGASTVGGNLVVVSSNGDLDVQDPSGGTVQVTGTATLSASGSGLGISIQSPVTSGTSLTLIANQNISQSSGGGADLLAGSVLYAQSTAGSISLNDPANQVGGIALLSAGGNVVLQTATSLTLGNVTASNGGKIKIVSGGNLTIESGSMLTSSQASGYSIQLAAAGNFINEQGANALSMPSGANFAIFSAAPGGDVFGGLNSGDTPIWGMSFVASAGQTTVTGNRYIFASQPTLTVSASNASKVYGVNDATSLQTGYTVSGLQAGLSGVYLADTVASVFGSTPVAVSTGSAATAGVGSYAITLSGITPLDGYAIATQNGTLTISPATLTYAANAASRAAGNLSPAFSGTVTGFVNSDTQASSTIGTLSFVSTATADSTAGSYAINGSGLTATNYVFVQAAGNATALTIGGSSQSQINGSTPVLTGFTAGLQPPLLNPANTPLGVLPFNLIALPVVPPPPPPPVAPPPPVPSPLADNNNEQPTSSDQTTTQVADSLNGNGPPPGSHGGGVVIPTMLVNARPPVPPPTDITALSSFGNSSLWQ